ncbi:MAG: AAA-like domain-containing protein [Proteobacteria bacterium]|nr:AAA-like domain-containing protein [Pseudomonadota bacterium]
MKRFNVTGTCYPDEHYMVDISERLEIIAQMIKRGDYFCINAGRQYGKTTTLYALKKKLEAEYCVFSLSFEGLADSAFESIEKLGSDFLWLMSRCVRFRTVNLLNDDLKELLLQLSKQETISAREFSDALSEMNAISAAPIVLIIDEVEQAGNYSAFIKFLGILRDMYLKRKETPTFQSVILAGVYDIKNLKLKIRPESEHQYNSPWNIAARFDVDMSLPVEGIEGMIAEYKNDHVGVPEVDGMKPHDMAQLIYDYTSGYPFLVSRLCQILDERKLRWDKDGFLFAEKELLHERNTLFDDMVKKLNDFPEMRQMFKEILLNGRMFAFNQLEKYIQIASLFNFIKEDDKNVKISNRIFETVLYDLFFSEDEMNEQ